ncbi:MAG TPA: GFA family protein [Acetobacteraceae bacterium]|nr:GFA family protein [Acetobacteraceae bacterium]
MRPRRGRALWRRRSLGVPLRPGPRTLSGAAAGLSVICRSSPENPSVGDDPLERTAPCQCGSLRAVTSGEPLRVSVCHCITCQRRTGSVLSCNAYFQKSSVRIEGAAGLYARRAESGREVRNYFCPDCATTLYWEADVAPDLYGMAVGAFANPAFAAPTSSFWEEAMHSWVNVPDTQYYPKAGSVPR